VQVKKALEGYEHECIDVFIIVILAILFIYGEKVEKSTLALVQCGHLYVEMTGDRH